MQIRFTRPEQSLDADIITVRDCDVQFLSADGSRIRDDEFAGYNMFFAKPAYLHAKITAHGTSSYPFGSTFQLRPDFDDEMQKEAQAEPDVAVAKTISARSGAWRNAIPDKVPSRLLSLSTELRQTIFSYAPGAPHFHLAVRSGKIHMSACLDPPSSPGDDG